MGLRLLFFVLLFSANGLAQPYTDLASFSYQHFAAGYRESAEHNLTSQYSLSLVIPEVLHDRVVFLTRVNAELIHSEAANTNLSGNLAGIAILIGLQFKSKSNRWSSLLFALPKLASDFKQNLSEADWQYGGLFVQSYTHGKLKLKAGLYYNKEAFGHFFVPLLGLDYQVTDRLYLYGTLPTNYKVEYALIKNKWYAGLDFKSLTRSFHLSGTEDYVRFDEILLKVFAERQLYKNLVATAQFGYTLGKSPLRYHNQTDALTTAEPLYALLQKCPIFNIGITYRLRP